MMLAEIVAIAYTTPPIRAQAPEPKQLTISILEGEGAINNIKQRTAREAIVQVQDENHKPVAGVAVTFFLADHGASGVFANGSQSMTVMTDANGQAAMRGMVPNKMAGKMEIRVSARLGNLNADAVITQTNVAGAAGAAGGAAISGKVIALIVVGAVAAAVVGGYLSSRGGGSFATPSPATPAPAVVITPGTPTVGHP
ncbi:MAG TPA: hypothetical protein VKF41_05280 [Bryobacteraceae bacterium]|nr:hypothetical protein [Bryobacteraceae bacterium]